MTLPGIEIAPAVGRRSREIIEQVARGAVCFRTRLIGAFDIFGEAGRRLFEYLDDYRGTVGCLPWDSFVGRAGFLYRLRRVQPRAANLRGAANFEEWKIWGNDKF